MQYWNGEGRINTVNTSFTVPILHSISEWQAGSTMNQGVLGDFRQYRYIGMQMSSVISIELLGRSSPNFYTICGGIISTVNAHI